MEKEIERGEKITGGELCRSLASLLMHTSLQWHNTASSLAWRSTTRHGQWTRRKKVNWSSQLRFFFLLKEPKWHLIQRFMVGQKESLWWQNSLYLFTHCFCTLFLMFNSHFEYSLYLWSLTGLIRTGQSPIYDTYLWVCLISHTLCFDRWTWLGAFL